MALLTPPFAEHGERRAPTPTERDLGLPCGPADRALFNDLWHRVEAEIGSVISYAGITQTDDRYTQLREAIQALIDAAVGGDTTDFVTVDMARSRLLFYPEVQNADGRIGVSTPSTGVVRVPGGVTFLHRGIYPVTTAQKDIATDASKTYHLRWNPTEGFVLRDLSSVSYNPSGFPETAIDFDSSYDSMLVSRVTTNSANSPYIVNLCNRHVLRYSYFRPYKLYPPGGLASPGVWESSHEWIEYDLARTPLFYNNGFETSGLNVVPDSVSDGTELNITPHALSRYSAWMFQFSWSFIYHLGGCPGYYGSFIAI